MKRAVIWCIKGPRHPASAGMWHAPEHGHSPPSQLNSRTVNKNVHLISNLSNFIHNLKYAEIFLKEISKFLKPLQSPAMSLLTFMSESMISLLGSQSHIRRYAPHNMLNSTYVARVRRPGAPRYRGTWDTQKELRHRILETPDPDCITLGIHHHSLHPLFEPA